MGLNWWSPSGYYQLVDTVSLPLKCANCLWCYRTALLVMFCILLKFSPTIFQQKQQNISIKQRGICKNGIHLSICRTIQSRNSCLNYLFDCPLIFFDYNQRRKINKSRIWDISFSSRCPKRLDESLALQMCNIGVNESHPTRLNSLKIIEAVSGQSGKYINIIFHEGAMTIHWFTDLSAQSYSSL